MSALRWLALTGLALSCVWCGGSDDDDEADGDADADADADGDADADADADGDGDADADADADADGDADADTDADADGDADGDVCTNGYEPFPAFDRSCEDSDECVVAVHQHDCCGSMVYMAIAADEADRFDEAESACRLANPALCGCLGTNTLEDGTVVIDGDIVVAFCDAGRCAAGIGG